MTNKTGKGFNLVMQLQDPSKLPLLMSKLKAAQPSLNRVLRSLDYVHFARFLPLWDHGLLLVVTEYDGEMRDYVMDFSTVLDDEFSLILSFMKDQPPLPVSRYPDKFWEYIVTHTGPKGNHPGAYADPFCAYPGLSVLDITGGSRAKMLPDKPAALRELTPDLADVQANILRGFRARSAVHLGFEWTSAQQGRLLLSLLSKEISSGEIGRNEPRCQTLGLTHAGLQALGVPQPVLADFPTAFREGPQLRSERLGDTGRNAPAHWDIGRFDSHGRPTVVHGMVSLYLKGEQTEMVASSVALRKVIEESGALICFEHCAQSLDDNGEVHFGYRDGIAQPLFAAGTPHGETTPSLDAPHGDILLGLDYPNSRGGNYIGTLPPELATHGTYAAMRLIEQDVAAFEALLAEGKTRHDIEPELLAAKLMGRWRNGSPLTDNPVAADPEAANKSARELDAFDYVAPPAMFDDKEGRRCPVGAHIRRLNPRGGLVLGVPWGRRIVRRGMPYGPRWNESDPEKYKHKRGLFGLFLCGDLESQFEFIQHAWANEDLSAPGLRNTQDPFIGARERDTPFTFRPHEADAEVTLMVPPLTRVRGSLYLFMPGIKGLAWLATAGWQTTSQQSDHMLPHGQLGSAARGPMIMDIANFNPASPAFSSNPYPVYSAFRQQAPVCRMKAPYNDAWWVFTDALVREVNDNKEFLKPDKEREIDGPRPFAVNAQFDDGLFFLNPPRHTAMRSMMNDVFKKAIEGARKNAAALANQLLDDALAKGRLEVVGDFAKKLAMPLFMRIMGVPKGTDDFREQMVLDSWTRSTLASHDKALPPAQRLTGATASMAMRAYFLALGKELANGGKGMDTTIMAGMQSRTGCPAAGGQITTFEAMNTAVHFALGGYLSTEFLIASGVYNLLSNPDQWQALKADRSLLKPAVQEMLRFDAPFQMADRWVKKEIALGKEKIPPGALVTVVYGSANRDEYVYRDPDRFDIKRKVDPAQNLGFGVGIHRCIGEPLALEIVEEAIGALVEKCPAARILDVGAWASDPYFRSLLKLDLALR